MPDHYLHFDAITRTFPGVTALDRVSFGVAEASVHALLGENGAGKSTLLKILSGLYQPDSGTVFLDRKPQAVRSTAEAIRAGIAVIYQELQLVPEMSVAENLYLGHLPSRLGWVNRTRLLQDAMRQLHVMGEDISPQAKVSSLPIAQRQMVEIAKALCRDAKIIAFDEPTSSLSSREVDALFAIIRKLRDQGRVIVYVSHRMEEVFEICDAATVLRDGKHVESFPTMEGVTRDTLVSRMVGRPIGDVFQYTPRTQGGAALEVEGLTGPGLGEPATFSVARGEILGCFGLVGAGRTELLKLIYGATPAVTGTVRVGGVPVRIAGPASAVRSGIMFCPEDRKKEGTIPVRSVMENLNLSGRRHFSRLGFIIDERREQRNAQTYVEKLDIKTPSLAQPMMNLSGGNQQKVILARWLGENIRVILLDEPTRGIDVGAKREIYATIYDLAERGIGVVMASSELPEVLGVCDRILVMRQGRIVASLPRGQATHQRVLELALPVTDGLPLKVST